MRRVWRMRGASGAAVRWVGRDEGRGRAGVLTLLCSVVAAAGMAQTASAASCGGLFQPRCQTSTTTGTGGTTTTRAACGGLLQPRCPTTTSTTGTGTSGGTSTTSAKCGGLLQPKCPPRPSQCADGVDNDKDGQRDLLDAGCVSSTDVSEYEDLAPDANGLPRGADVDPRTSGRRFGFNTFLGSWGSGVTAEQESTLIRLAGGDTQRFGVSWAVVQPTSPYYHRTDRLAPTDRMYQAALAQGITPIITISDSPVWASDLASCGLFDFTCQKARNAPPEHLPPRDITSYGEFVGWIARRYPAAVIEPWNEPNIRWFWGYSKFPDTQRMAAVQCAAFDAVRATGPGRMVLSAGFAMIRSQPASGQVPYVDYVEPMHHWMGRRCWDALSVHLYPSSNVDGPGSSTAAGMQAIRAVRARRGDATPIWITETGATTSGGQTGDHGHTQRTDAEQAEMLRLTMNELLTAPDVGAVIMHTLRDRGNPMGEHSTATSPQYGFGLLTDSEGPAPAPKPIWCHLTGVTGQAYPGCTVVGELTVRAARMRSRGLAAERKVRSADRAARRARAAR